METDKNIKEMNLWEKLSNIRVDFDNLNLKKEGNSSYSVQNKKNNTWSAMSIKFYELPDIMPKIIRLFKDYNLCYTINFSDKTAQMKLINSDNIEQTEIFTIPFINTNSIDNMQKIGAIVTYATRYIMYSVMCITENDVLDTIGFDNLQETHNKETSNNQKNNQNLNSDKKVDKNITKEEKLIKIKGFLKKEGKITSALKYFEVETLDVLEEKDLNRIIKKFKINL